MKSLQSYWKKYGFYRYNILVDTKTSQRRRKNVSVLVSKTFQIVLKWQSRRPFFTTSSRRLPGDAIKTSSRRRLQDVFLEKSSKRLPGDVLKTSLRRLKTSSRLFLVNAKDDLETIYELSMALMHFRTRLRVRVTVRNAT